MSSLQILILGGGGAIGGALARALVDPKRSGCTTAPTLVLADRDAAAAERVARSCGATSRSLDAHDPEAVAAAVPAGSVVIDATTFAGRDRAVPTAVLQRGAHWIDLAARRDWVPGLTELDALAKERGCFAISGAGPFCGLTDPFVRAAAAKVARTNEVLLGVLPGPRARLGPASTQEWLGGPRSRLRMAIGGEWSEREFFGDRRQFEHPPPFGSQRSFNLDVADLDLFTQRPVRSASVRLSLGLGSSLRNTVGERLFRGGQRPNALAKARRWSRFAGDPPGAVLTILVRGTTAKQLPLDQRISVADPGPEPRLETVAAVTLVRKHRAGAPGLAPGAGPCVDRLTEEEILATLAAYGLPVRRGNLGGWEK
jgi:hypothetical protein